MKLNTNLNIDDLIKKIYKSYIEIKTGDFREIDKDMLLNDIGNLYSSIKAMYPSPHSSLTEIELDIANIETANEYLPNSANISDENQSIKMDHVIIDVEEDSDNSHMVDLSIFEDENEVIESSNSETEEDESEPLIKSDNINSPIVKQFMNIFNKSEAIDNQKNIEEVELPEDLLSVESEEAEGNDNSLQLEQEEIIEEKPAQKEPEKKSADKIIDFLKHDDNKGKKDIYSFLDINTRIGLVEWFFKGNSLELTECLVKLNSMDDKEKCIQLIDKYAEMNGVKNTDEIYQQFVNLVSRKFQSDF